MKLIPERRTVKSWTAHLTCQMAVTVTAEQLIETGCKTVEQYLALAGLPVDMPRPAHYQIDAVLEEEVETERAVKRMN